MRFKRLYLALAPNIKIANTCAIISQYFAYLIISAVRLVVSIFICGNSSTFAERAIIVRSVGRGTIYLSSPMVTSTGSLLIASAANLPIITFKNISCGCWTRTNDLENMSLTSFLCSNPLLLRFTTHLQGRLFRLSTNHLITLKTSTMKKFNPLSQRYSPAV